MGLGWEKSWPHEVGSGASNSSLSCKLCESDGKNFPECLTGPLN